MTDASTPRVEPLAHDDPGVRALVAAHIDFARDVTPPGHVHALPTLPADLLVLGVRDERGVVIAIGALRSLTPDHGELKSMHVAADARGRGLGRAVLDALLAAATTRGLARVSLETGTGAAFAPARALYAARGFEPCAPFGPYAASDVSVCMTRATPPA